MPINDPTGELRVGLYKRMVQALNMIARSARARAVWSRKIRKNIKVGRVTQRGDEIFGYIEVGGVATNEHGAPVDVSAMARAFEYGSGEHATRGSRETYQIIAKNVPKLVFMGTHEFEGMLIKTPIVNHPGVAKRAFLNPAVQENRQKIRQILGEEFHQAVSKAIRISWSQTK